MTETGRPLQHNELENKIYSACKDRHKILNCPKENTDTTNIIRSQQAHNYFPKGKYTDIDKYNDNRSNCINNNIYTLVNYLNFEHPTFVPSILANNKTVHFLSLRVHLYYSESDVTSDGFIDNPI